MSMTEVLKEGHELSDFGLLDHLDSCGARFPFLVDRDDHAAAGDGEGRHHAALISDVKWIQQVIKSIGMGLNDAHLSKRTENPVTAAWNACRSVETKCVNYRSELERN